MYIDCTDCCCNSVLAVRRNGIHYTHPDASLTLNQCTLAGPVYTRMPLECHCLTQCILGYHLATQRVLAGYIGTLLEKLIWNCLTLECHWGNLDYCSLHWNTTGRTVTAPTHRHLWWSTVASMPVWNDSKWSVLCKVSFYLEFISLQWLSVLCLIRCVLQLHCVCLGYEHH